MDFDSLFFSSKNANHYDGKHEPPVSNCLLGTVYAVVHYQNSWKL